jgi:hypothetical protein
MTTTSSPPAQCIEIHLDGMTLRTPDGAEVVTLTAAGWINPQGIPTERVAIPLGTPAAIVSVQAVAEHQRKEDEAWLKDALSTLRAVARENATFTVDDVWEAIQMPPRDARTQMSRLMRAGERQRLMTLTDDTRPCMRNHGGRRVRVWHSLTHNPAASGRQTELGEGTPI